MTKPGMQMDRYAPFREIARSNDLDAVALMFGADKVGGFLRCNPL